MRAYLGALGALVAAVVGTIVLGRAWPGAARGADFFLLVVVYYAISRGRVRGIWIGALGGLVQDVLGSHYLGFYAFVKTAVAYLVGGLGSKFILQQPFPQVLALFLATVLDAMLAMLLSTMVGLSPPFSAGRLVQRAVLNSVLGLIVFRLAGRRSRAAAVARDHVR